MKSIINISLIFLNSYLLISCSEKIDGNYEKAEEIKKDLDYTDTTQNLKDVASYTIAAAVDFNNFKNDPLLKSIVFKNFDELVFNSELKHGAIVKSDGSFDYTIADEFVNLADSMKIYGHVLAWHRHQNTSYLNKLVGQIEVQELMKDPGFEKSEELNNDYWRIYNSGVPKGESTIIISSSPQEIKSGSKALKVINPTSYGTANYRVQIASHTFSTVPGQKYNIKYQAKSLSGNGIIMVSVQSSDGTVTHYPGGDKTISGNWQTVNLSFTPTKDSYRILFNLGKVADTYLIDDVSVYSDVAAPDYPAINSKLDTALNKFIKTTISRYKDKIRKWEVVNELFTDEGEIRSNSNSPTPIVNGQKEYGFFVWSEFLKRNYGYLAFKYAAEADPTAELYINDYGLEYSDRKIDSLISYVKEIKQKGAKLDGISTQMHIDIYLTKEKIDKMFQKLAGTGLKIRVSELDIRITNSMTPSTVSATQWEKQKEQYRIIVSSYNQFVPASQRAGISVWGVVDKYNWQYFNGSDFPNLFSVDYLKKSAYAGFLLGLSNQ